LHCIIIIMLGSFVEKEPVNGPYSATGSRTGNPPQTRVCGFMENVRGSIFLALACSLIVAAGCGKTIFM
jgi:hypothetical protein